MVDALLTILVEHGMVASVVAARVTYHTAPEAIQGAVAAALLGAGSVHLGSSEWCAKMLQDALPRDAESPELDAIAASVVERYAAVRQRIPGIGHRTHAEGDPRAAFWSLVGRQPVHYGALIDYGTGPVILSRSPELFFSVDEEGWIETRPMKGTAPRGASPEEDEAIIKAMLGDEKPRPKTA